MILDVEQEETSEVAWVASVAQKCGRALALELEHLSAGGDDHVGVAFVQQALAERFGGFGLAVHHKHFANACRVLAAEEVEQFGPVSMAGEAVNLRDLCTDGVHLAEDGDLFESRLLDACAQRRRRAVSHDQNRAARVLDMVGHMMLDASGLQHARSGDDDSRFGVEIELFGFLDGMDICQRVEAKRVGVSCTSSPNSGRLAEKILDASTARGESTYTLTRLGRRCAL